MDQLPSVVIQFPVHEGQRLGNTIRTLFKAFHALPPISYNCTMTLQEIEQFVAHLSPNDFAKFREWFLELDAKRFDEKIEQDVASGKLDALAESAIREHRAGNSTEL